MQYLRKLLDAFLYIIKYIFILFFVLIGAVILLGGLAELVEAPTIISSTFLLIITVVVFAVCLCLPYFILNKNPNIRIKKYITDNIFNKIHLKANTLLNETKPICIGLDKISKLFIFTKNVFFYIINIVSKIQNKYLIKHKTFWICSTTDSYILQIPIFEFAKIVI